MKSLKVVTKIIVVENGEIGQDNFEIDQEPFEVVQKKLEYAIDQLSELIRNDFVVAGELLEEICFKCNDINDGALRFVTSEAHQTFNRLLDKVHSLICEIAIEDDPPGFIPF